MRASCRHGDRATLLPSKCCTASANVFNPAALGLVVVYLFDSAQSWWGALPTIVPGAAWPILLGSAADRLARAQVQLASAFGGYLGVFQRVDVPGRPARRR